MVSPFGVSRPADRLRRAVMLPVGGAGLPLCAEWNMGSLHEPGALCIYLLPQHPELDV